MNEFEIIEDIFAPLALGEPGALGLVDDAALIDLSSGNRLVTSVDSVVSGAHFFSK